LRLLGAYQDLAQIKTPAVQGSAAVYVPERPGPAVARWDRLSEGEDVGRLVDTPEPLVERAHLGVGHECNLHLRIAR
jgi:hypothetical protein